MAKRIICIGDSNTWGYDPRSFGGGRYPEGVRWTSLLGDAWQVENLGENGREIPVSDFAVRILLGQISARLPADGLCVMLGTNDLLCGASPAEAARRMEGFLDRLRDCDLPLLLVALGGMFSEHSGVINIALEGMMIIGALFACFTLQAFDQSGFGPAHPQLAMLVAILVAGLTGVIFSFFLGFAAINLKADQTIGGTALNQFAPAFAVVMTWAIQGQGLTTIAIPSWVRITRETFGLAPVEGPSFWNNLIFKYFYLTTPIAVILFIVAYIVMYKTRFGLRLRACGEHPQAADSVGINVYKMRYAGVLISGFLGGIGGLAYTVAAGSGFNSDVGGYGFLALAVMIFGNWKPFPILASSVFFALFKVIAAYSSSLSFLPKFDGVKEISNFYQMLPYIVTMIVLIFTSKNSQAPKAEGIPYDKGSR